MVEIHLQRELQEVLQIRFLCAEKTFPEGVCAPFEGEVY